MSKLSIFRRLIKLLSSSHPLLSTHLLLYAHALYANIPFSISGIVGHCAILIWGGRGTTGGFLQEQLQVTFMSIFLGRFDLRSHSFISVNDQGAHTAN